MEQEIALQKVETTRSLAEQKVEMYQKQAKTDEQLELMLFFMQQQEKLAVPREASVSSTVVSK